jgi:hypothetical protein
VLPLDLDNGSAMMRPIQASQDGQLYAISHQGLRVYLDYLGGLRLSFEHDDGSLRQSMVLSPQEATGLRELLNQNQAAQPADE